MADVSFLRTRYEQDGKRVLSRRTNDMHTPPTTSCGEWRGRCPNRSWKPPLMLHQPQRPGRQHVDPDTGALEVSPPRTVRRLHCRLARAVGTHSRGARGAGARSGQDDRTAFAHQRQRLLDREARGASLKQSHAIPTGTTSKTPGNKAGRRDRQRSRLMPRFVEVFV